MQLPVAALAFSPGGGYALSASRGERQIALWRMEGGSGKKRQASAGLLSLEEPAVRIATSASPSGADEGSFQALHPFHCGMHLHVMLLGSLPTLLQSFEQ